MIEKIVDFPYEDYVSKVKKNNQIVTVFMLTHNREYYAHLTMESILRQTYKNFQLIVLDNESIDNTKRMVESIDDDRIIYYYRKSTDDYPNPFFAMRTCVTRYILIIHDDDIYEESFLEDEIKEINRGDYDALSVAHNLIDENGIIIRKHNDKGFPKKLVWENNEYFTQYFSNNAVSMVYPSVIYKVSFFKNNNCYEGCFGKSSGPAGDQLIWFNVGKFGGRICLLNKALINYRVHKNQDSYNYSGYLTFQLVDYLVKNDYYRQLIVDNNISIGYKLWSAFKAVSKKYYMGLIGEDDYKKIRQYKCVQCLEKYHYGFLYKDMIILAYTFRRVLRFALKLRLKG